MRPSEIHGQRFTKAGAGPVTVQTIATFGVASRPAVKLGTYEPGTPGISTELFDVDVEQAQTVQVTPRGSTAFDPGGSAFGFYATFPGFRNADGSVRTVYSEDSLNTWEPPNRLKHKVRFYPLKTAAGTLVKNAYVMAFEEFAGTGSDGQDIVAIVRNITPTASAPELGLEVPTGSPFPDRMVFNKIRTLDPVTPNRTLTEGTLRIKNTGTRTLAISSIVPSGPFELVGAPPTSVAPGASADVRVRFTATGGSLHPASLSIFSNDPDEPRKVVALMGYWQRESENQQEPDLTRIFRMYGFGTVILNSGQQLNQGGQSGVTVGDEVLSPYWREADPSMPVTVRQLNAFHTQGDRAALNWHVKGSNTVTQIVRHAATDGQSFFPRRDGSSSALATGSFNPATGTVFGFRVDANEWSDDTKNEFGHQVRFFPVRDRDGTFVPNAYFLVMDYDGINYDYNDNVYLITNIRPELGPSTPVGLTAIPAGSNRVSLNWGDSPDAGFDSFAVLRSTSPSSGFTTLSNSVTTSNFVDTTATSGTTYYYRVRTNADGRLSTPASTKIAFA
jgi:hypothetical protein